MGVCATAILTVSVIPVAPAPYGLPWLDKVAHLCEYLVFAWVVAQAPPPTWLVGGQACPSIAVAKRTVLLWAWIVVTSYGWLIEVLQHYLPWRAMDPLDGLMNALGAGAGIWLGRRLPAPKGV